MGRKHADIPAAGSLAGSALTGAYQTLLDASDDDIILLMVFNSCDDTVLLSLDGGTTTHFILPEERSFVVDLRPLELAVPSPLIQAKHNGAAPTAGLISVTVMR